MRYGAHLDWLNFFLADVRGGLGPCVGVFLLTRRTGTRLLDSSPIANLPIIRIDHPRTYGRRDRVRLRRHLQAARTTRTYRQCGAPRGAPRTRHNHPHQGAWA